MSPALRAWIEEVGGGRIADVRRLQGGIATPVHQVALVGAMGARRVLVVRHWTGGDAAAGRSDVAIEADVLARLAPTAVPAPALVAASDGDPSGGVPALVMSRRPGRVDLDARDRGAWLRQMAGALAEVHASDVPAAPVRPGRRADPSEPPVWSTRRALWSAALAAVAEPPPEGPVTFLHGDYQHFNLLWTRGRLTGIVDWTGPRRGAPSVDVAHCILNLAVLYGVEVADRFRELYEQASGRRVEPWWELQALTMYGPDWQRFIPIQVAGRVAVDVAGMTGRVEAAIDSALRRRA